MVRSLKFSALSIMRLGSNCLVRNSVCLRGDGLIACDRPRAERTCRAANLVNRPGRETVAINISDSVPTSNISS